MSDWCPICKMRKANPAKCPHGEFLKVTEPGVYVVEWLERQFRAWQRERFKLQMAAEEKAIKAVKGSAL